jgi:hypothetical protein
MGEWNETMTETASLSRKAFKRGVDEALTLGPLRRILSGQWTGGAEHARTNGNSEDTTRVVTVVKSGRQSWHVKRSS